MKSRMEDGGSKIARVSVGQPPSAVIPRDSRLRRSHAPCSIFHPLSSLPSRWHVRYLLAIVLLCGLAGACADKSKEPTTKPLTMQQRQQKALQDPFGYKLTDEDFPSVTGGGTTDLDKKAVKRDMDSFWNP